MGDITSLDTQPMSEQVCPECAAPTSQREVPPPWPVRRRRLVQVAALLIALGYIVWRNIEAWPVLPTPVVYRNVPYSAEFPARRFTRSKVERYASGEITDGRLIDVLDIEVAQSAEFGVSFVPPACVASESRRYGWPHTIVFYRYDAEYDDAYAKTNPSTRPWTFRNGWWGWTYILKRIDATGRRETFMFSSKGLAGGPLVLIAAWSAGRLLRWMAFVLRLAGRDRQRRRDQLAHLCPVLCAIACAVGITIASLVPQSDPGWSFPTSVNPACSDTGITGADIAQFVEDPTGEADLARSILDATSETASNPGACLVTAWRSDIGLTITTDAGGWPDSLVRKTITEQQGFRASSRPTLDLDFQRQWVVAVLRWKGELERTEHTSFSLVQAAPLALGLCAVWIATGLGAWLVGWTVRRRTARRLTRGWCVQCGYDLKGLSDAGEDVTRT